MATGTNKTIKSSTSINDSGRTIGWELNPKQSVDLGFSALGDIFSYYSQLNSASNQSFVYSFQAYQSKQNSMLIEQEMKDILREGNEQVNKMKEEALRVRGEQVAEMGASGFDVNSKTYKDILSETDRNIESNAATIRENTMSAYANKKYQQQINNIQGELYAQSSRISNKKDYGSLISAGLKTAALSYFGG